MIERISTMTDSRSRLNSITAKLKRYSSLPEDFQLDEIPNATDNVLRRIERSLSRDRKAVPKGINQDIKLAHRHHNATSIKGLIITPDHSLIKFRKGKKALKKEAALFRKSDEKRKDLKDKRRFARRLGANDLSETAEAERNSAELAHHKAHKISASINLESASDNLDRVKIEKLRKILFINHKEEAAETTFMGNVFEDGGRKIKELARFVTGANVKDLQVFYYGKTPGHEPSFQLLESSNQNNQRGNRLTNQDVYVFFHKGLKSGMKEIPIAQVRSSSGKILFEITCSEAEWNLTHPSIPKNYNGHWTGGNINFYHRQKNIKGKQVGQMIERWLEVGK